MLLFIKLIKNANLEAEIFYTKNMLKNQEMINNFRN